MVQQPYRELKDDDKRWRAEEGARTLRNYAELIKDPEWLEAAKKVLEDEIKAGQKALDYVEMSGKE